MWKVGEEKGEGKGGSKGGEWGARGIRDGCDFA